MSIEWLRVLSVCVFDLSSKSNHAWSLRLSLTPSRLVYSVLPFEGNTCRNCWPATCSGTNWKSQVRNIGQIPLDQEQIMQAFAPLFTELVSHYCLGHWALPRVTEITVGFRGSQLPSWAQLGPRCFLSYPQGLKGPYISLGFILWPYSWIYSLVLFLGCISLGYIPWHYSPVLFLGFIPCFYSLVAFPLVLFSGFILCSNLDVR